MATEKIINKSSVDDITATKTETGYDVVVSVWTGILTSIAFIGFFLIMKAAGLTQILSFRYFNFLIFVIALISAFYVYRQHTGKRRINYMIGLKIGLRIILIAIIPFVIFMFIYLRMDDYFMVYIRENSEFGKNLSPISTAAVVAIEGFVGGAITTFMAMQYFKDNAT